MGKRRKTIKNHHDSVIGANKNASRNRVLSVMVHAMVMMEDNLSLPFFEGEDALTKVMNEKSRAR